ncbi:MAG: NAD(P) transhydrogenase subunit alpha [Clostridiaceae bacterium]|nr:NAD(P) transhydrogenase subunit alpha [Clostridiaceae bacterium]
MHPLILVLIFLVATLIGYKLISQVPSLLHTPLMSGMNALSGITVLGALTAAGAAVHTGNRLLGYIAIIMAMVNVAGGFGVTERMLRFFRPKNNPLEQNKGDNHE